MSHDGNCDPPAGWIWLGFDDAADSVSTTGKKVKKRDYLPFGSLPVIDQGQEFIGGYTEDADKRVDCESPVIVFGDHTKALKFVDFEFVAGADGVRVIKPIEAFYPKLFFYFLRALELPDRGYSRHFQFLRKETIPLPPLPEQQRIVAEIEKQFTRLDAGLAALKRAQANLRRYKAAVLKAACEGRLVPTEAELAHAEGRNYEPASQLLRRILAERRARWEAEHRGKRYKDPAPPDSDNLPELSEGWIWASLEQLSEYIVDCLHSTPKFTSEGKYCIDTTCIEPGRILFEKARFVSEETYQHRVRRLVPEAGDILFAREGTIGTAVTVPEGVDLCLGQRMMMFRPAPVVVSSYFMWSMLALVFERQWKPRVIGTTAPHVNIRDLRVMALPLPPLAEQLRIAAEVERRLSVVQGLEAAVETNLKRAERLRQAILKRAFEGKLVPQDPADEPAGVLLARIRAERARRRLTGKAKRAGSRKKNGNDRGSQQLRML